MGLVKSLRLKFGVFLSSFSVASALTMMSAASSTSLSSYDLVVIGGGSAGLTAAKLAATFDKSVVIIEKDRMGGVSFFLLAVNYYSDLSRQ